MSVRKNAPSPLRLTLPAAAIRRLREAGIYCTPEISLEFQRTGSGTFSAVVNPAAPPTRSAGMSHSVANRDNGCRGSCDPDSVTPNAEHAIVIAPALVSVEMFRIEHTYELLVAQHEVQTAKEGSRPTLSSRVVFRGWQGQLPLDLVEKDRGLAGRITPEFFSRAGEPRQWPAVFVDAVQSRNPWFELCALRTPRTS